MRPRYIRSVLGGLAALALLATSCSDDSDDSDDDEASATQDQDDTGDDGDNGDGEDEPSGGTLQEVRDRGTLNCGVNDVVPGFGFTTDEGDFEGFDIDFCRVIAAAVLGDADAVEYEPLTADERFTSLQSGAIDVLVRNTTWTALRDGGEGATFLTTTFYDGQGMMVRADSGFDSIDDMNGTDICVLSGTTTQLNLEDRMRGLDYQPQPYEDNDQIEPVFAEGACDGWTSDKSQLAGIRSNWPEEDGGPESLVIFEDAFSKEPLGPVVRDGDQEWASAVDWAVIATIQAEEFGIDSGNVEEMKGSEDPAVLRFLGGGVPDDEGEMGPAFDPGLNLDTDFAANVISQVGNYGEIYERNVGPDTPLGLDRGVNALWTEGGLLYAPPYR